MVRRAGVGATAVSAVVFSLILIANTTVYFASHARAHAYDQSNLEDFFADSSVALSGVAGANLLVKAQMALSSGPLGCEGANQRVSQLISGLADVQTVDNLTLTATAAPASAGASGDNLSMLDPFAGFEPADLNIAFRVVARGADSSLGVSFAKSETHFAHLPLDLEALVSLCLTALRGITSAVSGQEVQNCTASVVLPLIDAAALPYSVMASDEGFRLDVNSTTARSVPCSVRVQVSVQQTEVVGPAGYFSVLVQEAELASFEQPPV